MNEILNGRGEQWIRLEMDEVLNGRVAGEQWTRLEMVEQCLPPFKPTLLTDPVSSSIVEDQAQ